MYVYLNFLSERLQKWILAVPCECLLPGVQVKIRWSGCRLHGPLGPLDVNLEVGVCWWPADGVRLFARVPLTGGLTEPRSDLWLNKSQVIWIPRIAFKDEQKCYKEGGVWMGGERRVREWFKLKSMHIISYKHSQLHNIDIHINIVIDHLLEAVTLQTQPAGQKSQISQNKTLRWSYLFITPEPTMSPFSGVCVFPKMPFTTPASWVPVEASPTTATMTLDTHW